MPKQLIFNQDARRALAEGAEKLAAAVRETLGPRGHTVAIDRGWGAPNVTKDGASVADDIDLTDPYENLGARMLKEAASKTGDDTGDGTTTATVLASAMFREGFKAITAGGDPIRVQRGLMTALETATDAIRKQATALKTGSVQLKQIATVAANGDEVLGELIADAFQQVGADGVVTIEEGKGTETTLSVVEGMQFDRGYLATQFANSKDKVTCELENPYILIHEDKLTDGRTLLNLLDKVAQARRPILIIAENVEEQALATLVVNAVRGNLQACAVKAPGYGQRRKAMLQDIGTLTKAQPLFKDLAIDLESAGLDVLGTARKVIVTGDTCTIVEGAGSKKDVKARCEQIKVEISRTTSEYDREKLQERLAKLAGGVAEIGIGAGSETELKERKARAEDALNACRAALEEGVVPGGGVALLKARIAVDKLDLDGDQALGVKILSEALSEPIRRIAENGGHDGGSAIRKVLNAKGKNQGFNVLTGEVEDFIKAGIVDAAKIVRLALTNAASTAGIMLTTEALISEEPEKDDEEHDHHHHHHH